MLKHAEEALATMALIVYAFIVVVVVLFKQHMAIVAIIVNQAS